MTTRLPLVSSVFAVPLASTVFLLGALAACGGGADNLPPPPAAPPAAPEPLPVASSTEDVEKNPKLPVPTLMIGEAAADPAAPLPTVRITAPAKDQVIKDKAGEFEVKLDVKNWKTAEGDAHVHLILDNKPYKPIYDTKAPVKLSELSGGEALAEGEHVLVAFPSRKTHESVKTKGSLFAVRFFVGKRDPKTDLAKAPTLVYSRPKGEYKGPAASHVLVDFNLLNAELGAGKNQVKLVVSGPGIDGTLAQVATTFGPPFYLDNLRTGTYTIRAELNDKDGKPVAGPWNTTTRTIAVDPGAPTDPNGGHGGHGPAPAASGAAAAPPKDAGAKPAGK